MEWSGRDEGDNGATLMLYTSKGKKKGIRTRPVGNTGTRKRRRNNKTRHTLKLEELKPPDERSYTSTYIPSKKAGNRTEEERNRMGNRERSGERGR